MATYWVVCITKKTRDDPHERITKIGTSTLENGVRSRLWEADDVIKAIDNKTDEFWCNDKAGEKVKVITAERNGRKYLKTENDDEKQDNLLAQEDC